MSIQVEVSIRYFFLIALKYFTTKFCISFVSKYSITVSVCVIEFVLVFIQVEIYATIEPKENGLRFGKLRSNFGKY